MQPKFKQSHSGSYLNAFLAPEAIWLKSGHGLKYGEWLEQQQRRGDRSQSNRCRGTLIAESNPSKPLVRLGLETGS